jgi:hypothetical protein
MELRVEGFVKFDQNCNLFYQLFQLLSKVMASTLFLVMVVHDINSSNKILPTFAGYDNSYSLDNVQLVDQGGELEIPKHIGGYEQNIIELRLENLWK